MTGVEYWFHVIGYRIQWPLVIHPLLVALLLSIVLLFTQRSRSIIPFVWLFLVAYLILYATVLCRTRHDVLSIELNPLLGIKKILQGSSNEVRESLLNVALFIPLGFMLGICAPGLKWFWILAILFFFSLCIESVQFITMRGFFQTSDLLYNTFGGMAGLGVAALLLRLIKSLH